MERWINFQDSQQQRLVNEQFNEDQNKVKDFGIANHALIRGVAGSGKSLVLRNRIEKLIDEGVNDILVVCYNRFMNGWINSKVKPNFKLKCTTFHSWAATDLKYSYEWDCNDEARQKIIDLAEKSGLQYEAILVDEAQDFYDEWFTALLRVLNQDTNSLFFVYDNTQSVYDRPHRRKADWTWKKLGLEIPGARSQIFDVNYRNAPEILETAWQFILPALNEAGMKVAKREKARGEIGTIVEPKKKASRSSGIKPLLLQMNASEMAETIAGQIQLARETHIESSIGILTHPDDRPLREEISQRLKAAKIPHHAPRSSRDRNGNVVDRSLVVIDSWNAVKGIEFDAVILAGIKQLSEVTEFQEKAALYTAMTRARDHLVMIYQDKSAIVQEIEAAIAAPDQLEAES